MTRFEREASLSSLQAAFEDAGRGAGRLILVTGEAGITSKTASHRVSSILTKLGVRSRTAAAAEAGRRGIALDAKTPAPPKDAE